MNNIPVRIVLFPLRVRPGMLFALWLLRHLGLYDLKSPQIKIFYRFREREPAQGAGNKRVSLPLTTANGCTVDLGTNDLFGQIAMLIRQNVLSAERRNALLRMNNAFNSPRWAGWAVFAKWIHAGLTQTSLKEVAEQGIQEIDKLLAYPDLWQAQSINLPVWKGVSLALSPCPWLDFDQRVAVSILRELRPHERLDECATVQIDGEGGMRPRTKTTLRTSIKTLRSTSIWPVACSPEPTVLYIAGDPGIGKSTLAASMYIWLAEMKLRELQSIWRLTRQPLDVATDSFDRATPTLPEILRNEKLDDEDAAGQNHAKLRALKRPWDIDLVREIHGHMEQYSQKQLIIADLPGRATEITESLLGLPGYALIMNKGGRESVTHWRTLFGKMGIDVVADLTTGQHGSLLSKYNPGEYVAGSTGIFRRVAKPGDACVQHISQLLFWDVIPFRIAKRWKISERAQHDPEGALL